MATTAQRKRALRIRRHARVRKQIVGTTASHFDDRDEVRAALAARALAQRA